MHVANERAPVRRAHADDAELVVRVLNGDDDAYADLVARYQAVLYRYACGMGFDHDSASDAVQEAFVRAYQDLHRCRQPDRFAAWLLRILRNYGIDQKRSSHGRCVSLDESVAGSVTPVAVRAELRAAIDNAFDALPPGLREAFLLKHVEEWSYDEMAFALDASVSALKMRVHRARELLREALAAVRD